MVSLPHIYLLADFGWFGVRCGVAYYDISNDVLRPAFIEFMLWQKWRVTFEAGRTSKRWNGYGRG